MADRLQMSDIIVAPLSQIEPALYSMNLKPSGNAIKHYAAMIQELENRLWGPDVVKGDRHFADWDRNYGLSFPDYEGLALKAPGYIFPGIRKGTGELAAFCAFLPVSYASIGGGSKLPDYAGAGKLLDMNGDAAIVINMNAEGYAPAGITQLITQRAKQDFSGEGISRIITSWPANGHHAYFRTTESAVSFWTGTNNFIPDESRHNPEWGPVAGDEPGKFRIKTGCVPFVWTPEQEGRRQLFYETLKKHCEPLKIGDFYDVKDAISVAHENNGLMKLYRLYDEFQEPGIPMYFHAIAKDFSILKKEEEQKEKNQ